jgi:uncharacterized protein
VKISRTGTPSFHLLAKPVGPTCNLECKYCFFLAKDKLYPGSSFRMDEELLENYIIQLIEASPGPEVTVAWQGGEPTLMGLDFFRRSIEVERKYARPGMRVLNTIQTNGTLIDDDWAAFLKDNNFLVGISIDGPRALHDCYRVDKGGSPTFDRVMRGLKFLQKRSVDWNILAAVHAANADHPLEVYRFFRDECNAKFIQFIPIVERLRGPGTSLGNKVTDRSVKPAQFGKFMITVFEDWVRGDIGAVYVQMFDAALANWHGVPSGLCVSSATCGTALVMEHNGDVYSCDHFVDPGYRLGNINDSHLTRLAFSDQQVKFGRNKLTGLPGYCRRCEVLFACHGGCPKDRFSLAPDGETGLNYLCSGYKTFFKHVDRPMRSMSRLISKGDPPSQIMDTHLSSGDGG